jgi:hypothetical protein
MLLGGGNYVRRAKKLDIGKGCGRFKSLQNLALDLVGRTVARMSAEEHIANYQRRMTAAKF